MRLSDKRQSALYSSISDPITDLRVNICMSLLSDSIKNEMDDKLYRLEQEIWRRAKAALDLEGA